MLDPKVDWVGIISVLIWVPPKADAKTGFIYEQFIWLRDGGVKEEGD